MHTRRDLLLISAKASAGLAATAAPALSKLCPARPVEVDVSGPTKVIPFGAAINPYKLRSNVAYAAAYKKYCQQIVPETGMKWTNIQNIRGKFDFSLSDEIDTFGEKHNLAVRGHTLMWDCAKRMPDWVRGIATASEAERELVNYIKKVVERYKGRIDSWDVVNEPLDQCLGKPKPGPSIWKKLLGLEYIVLAFEAAKAADPAAKLVLNEYGIETDASKRERLLDLVCKLLNKGARIDAVGLQCHLGGHRNIDVKGLRKFVRELDRLKVKVLITELDVKDYKLRGSPKQRDEIIAAKTQELLLAVKNPTAVLTWGLTDQYSWLRSVDASYRRTDGRPLPLDEFYEPKEMMKVIQKFCRRVL